MRPKRPSTMSLKLMAMVVVRKKIMMVCVCGVWPKIREKRTG